MRNSRSCRAEAAGGTHRAMDWPGNELPEAINGRVQSIFQAGSQNGTFILDPECVRPKSTLRPWKERRTTR